MDRINKSNIILIVYWFLNKVTINIIGQFILSEVFSIILFPFYSVKRLFQEFIGIKGIVLGFCALLFFQIVSDFINQTAFADFSRGWAAIIFSCLSFLTLSRFISLDNDGILVSLLSLFILNILFGRGTMDASLIAEDSNYFKVRYTPFLNPLFLMISYFIYKYRNYISTVIWFILIGFFYFYMDARSNGLFYFFTGIILFFRQLKVDFNLRLLLFLVLIFGVGLLYVLYVYSVLNLGFGGKNAFNQLSNSPNPFNPVWLLVYGRTEVIVLLSTIYDNPIFGSGSWAKDHSGLYANFASDFTGLKLQTDTNVINPHSIFFGYWAFAGIGGFISILFIYLRLSKMYFKIYKSELQILYFPILTYFFCEITWMFLFSPIGEMRVSFPFIAALILIAFNYIYNFRNLNE
jgi:hypothetical protein